MSMFFDALETREPLVREVALLAALPGQIANAQANARAFAVSLRGIDSAGVTTRARLAALPVIRKNELLEAQRTGRAGDLFGGFSSISWGDAPPARRASKVFASPGPIYEPEAARPDYWRQCRGAAGAGAGLEADHLDRDGAQEGPGLGPQDDRQFPHPRHTAAATRLRPRLR